MDEVISGLERGPMAALVILSRWLHVVTACLVIGGVFFMRFLLPRGLAELEGEAARPVLAKTRRSFKMLVHCGIAIFLVSGAFNASVAWNKYALNPPLLHMLLGIHILLALVVFAAALYVLAGAQPRASHRKLMVVNFALLLATVAAASTLKWARDRAVDRQLRTMLFGEKQ